MKRVLKISGGIVGVLLVLALGLAAWLVIGGQRPASPVGSAQVRVADPGHGDIPALIWHPTDSSALQVQADHVTVASPRMTVRVQGDFRATGPHAFSKAEDNGYHFNASLVSFVRPDQVVSVVAERLVEDVDLDYSDLSPATWPDHRFLARSRGCASLTPAQAAAMPPETGMAWIRQAGFRPQGSFAFEAALMLAPDRRHEATVELIAPVTSCKDPKAIEAALGALRARVQVSAS